EISPLVGPFLSPCGSLQQWVQQLLVGLPAVLPRHLEVIARVNESLGLVVGWFSRYQGKALESAIATAQALQDTGRLEVSLAQSSFSARIRYQAAGFKSTTHLSEAEARELVQQLTFYSRGQSDPNASVKVAVSCRDLCRKAMNVVSKLRTLRSKGHPQYQCCQVLVPLSSIPELDAEAEGLQQQCQDWERLWRQKRRDHPLLAFFDSHELFSMVVLCSGHPLRRNVIEAMRNVQWPKEEEEDKELLEQLSAECLASFVHSLQTATFPAELALAFRRHSVPSPSEQPKAMVDALLRVLDKAGVAVAPKLVAKRSGRQEAVSLDVDNFRMELSLLARSFQNRIECFSGRCVLRCHDALPHTALEDFLQRCESLPGGTFVILGVNLLSARQQRRVQSFQLQLNQEDHHAQVVYAYSGAVPQLPDFIKTSSLSPLSDQELQTSLRPLQKSLVTLICGLPGTGKTEQMKGLVGDVPLLSITEQYDEAKAQATLNTLAARGERIGLKISENADKRQVNRLLFDLITGAWRIPDGSIFAESPSAPLRLCIEVPHCPHLGRTPEESMRNDYPVLGVCEHQLMVVTNTSQNLNVGPDERFVAKYLQAGKNGTIDKLSDWRNPVTHEEVRDDSLCRQLIQEAFASHTRATHNKRNIKSFVQYLVRRFQFFSKSHFYLYNGDHRHMGSALLGQMLREAAMLSEPNMTCSVEQAMLVYDDEFALYVLSREDADLPANLQEFVAEGRRHLQNLEDSD
ncbi:unnamed protein product, partial [Effrenium voratum]